MPLEGFISTDKIAEERAFIHDLSSPLMVALGMVDFTANKLPEEQTALLEKLQKAQKALNRIATLLKDRRSLLLKELESFDS